MLGTSAFAKQPSLEDVDIDPGWYPGQPELEDNAVDTAAIASDASLPPEVHTTLTRAGDGSEHHDVNESLNLSRASSAVPTVLTKLQKWGDYDSVGNQVYPTKFIPMKTPLSAELLDSWSLPSQPRHRLTVPDLLATQAAAGRRVGLILDLSNHECLYTQDIPEGVRYTHIKLVAKELPPPEFVDEVIAEATRFWSENPDEYIAIHCAYGFNRTGFTVCCYLIEMCGLSVEEALHSFATARPPGVKHEAFRAELIRRYVQSSGYGGVTLGSPGDNSSFGCSPSCRSAELRDMMAGGSLGPSPMGRHGQFTLSMEAGLGGSVGAPGSVNAGMGYGMAAHALHLHTTVAAAGGASAPAAGGAHGKVGPAALAAWHAGVGAAGGASKAGPPALGGLVCRVPAAPVSIAGGGGPRHGVFSLTGAPAPCSDGSPPTPHLHGPLTPGGGAGCGAGANGQARAAPSAQASSSGQPADTADQQQAHRWQGQGEGPGAQGHEAGQGGTAEEGEELDGADRLSPCAGSLSRQYSENESLGYIDRSILSAFARSATIQEDGSGTDSPARARHKEAA